MLFKSAETKCLFAVLKILDKRKSRYKLMLKETGVSHNTLQAVLKYLTEKQFIKRHESWYKSVEYEISKKGEKFLRLLLDVVDILE